MGKSDKERASDQMYKDASSNTQQRIGEQKSLLASNLSSLDADYNKSADMLKKATSARLQGVSLQMGEALASNGIAGGHDQANAWIASQSPIIAQENSSLASLLQNKATTSSGMRSQLMQIIQALYGQQDNTQLNAINGMKDSTDTGDILSVVSPVAQLVLAGMTGGASAVPSMLSSSDLSSATKLFGKPTSADFNSMEWNNELDWSKK